MTLITGSKRVLLYFYFKNNIFSDKNNLESYNIKTDFLKNLRETIIDRGIYKLYYSEHAPKDQIIAYKGNI